MANIFQKISVPKVHKSNFTLNHSHQTTMKGGFLIPIDCVECLPNDTFQGSCEAFVRLAPLQYPVMHRLSLKTYTFFVPNRIIWKYWQKFIAEDKDDVAPSALVSYISSLVRCIGGTSESLVGSLYDYFGLPTVDFSYSPSFSLYETVSLLPFLAYQKIWNDYFRDENLSQDLFDESWTPNLQTNFVEKQGHVTLLSNNIPRPFASQLLALRRKAWEKDYFTSSLPEPQYGVPVPVPVSTDTSSLSGTVNLGTSDDSVNLLNLLPGTVLADGNVSGVQNVSFSTTSSGSQSQGNLVAGNSSSSPVIDSLQFSFPSTNSFELSSSPGSLSLSGLSFTINDLRLASAIQRFQELLNRGGHRYAETIMSLFNQITPDYRLDRPEFICSMTQDIQISDIPQTSATQDNSPQGSLAGKGISYGQGGSFKYHCYEHGFLITLACILPRSEYMNGLPRMWSRKDRYDYFTPAFEELGDQAVLNKELFVSSNLDTNNEVFGYSPRYSEYKYLPSRVSGEFRTSLDFMTMARKFSSLPGLGEQFVSVDSETVNRPFAVTSDDTAKFYCYFQFHLKARRPMQYNPQPRLV